MSSLKVKIKHQAEMDQGLNKTHIMALKGTVFDFLKAIFLFLPQTFFNGTPTPAKSHHFNLQQLQSLNLA